MERIECSTPDITQENIERLTELFPSVVTETTDADGNPQKAIDFDALRELLGDVAEGQRERYQFTWPGKREAKSLARTPCDKTMRPHALDGMVSNGLETKVPANKINDNFERKEFQELWGRIHGKYAYTMEFDSAELVDHAVARIDKDLMVSELAYAMTVGTQHDELQRDDLDAGQFKVRRTAQEKVDAGAVTGVTYDLLGEVAAQASITRRTAAAILAKIHPAKFSLYAKNPEEFIAKVAKLIVSEKATMVVDHVEYHAIDDEYDTAIFTERMPRNASSAMSVKKSIQDYVFPDSDGEAGFAHDLDAADEVEVYAKLPRTFAIPTPVGNYAPDWAIAFKQGTVQHVYFVAETKGTLDTLEPARRRGGQDRLREEALQRGEHE